MPTDNMGIIIENPGFMEDETAMKNLQYLAKLNNHIEKKQVEKTIIRVGLDPKENGKKLFIRNETTFSNCTGNYGRTRCYYIR